MPTYDVTCRKCGKDDERFCYPSELADLTCECGGTYRTRVSKNSGGFTIYGQDYNGGTIDGYTFKGPKDKANYLARRGMIEIGDEPPQSIADAARNERALAEEKEKKEIEKIVVDEVIKGGGFLK